MWKGVSFSSLVVGDIFSDQLPTAKKETEKGVKDYNFSRPFEYVEINDPIWKILILDSVFATSLLYKYMLLKIIINCIDIVYSLRYT